MEGFAPGLALKQRSKGTREMAYSLFMGASDVLKVLKI